MNLDKLKTNWEGLGESDPFWAVLTEPSKINNKWDKTDFFKSGQNWVNQVFLELELDEKLKFKSAMDFGCGPGRLTQALCNRFDSVTGVDISASMIKEAISLNKFKDSCEYLVNSTDDLSQIPSNKFDFILSFITLQHISPIYIFNYIKEFKRVVKKDGFILFNLPTRPPVFLNILLKVIGPAGVNMLRRIYYRKRHVIEMNWIVEEEMINFFKVNGLQVEKMVKDEGVGSSWKSFFYLLKKID